MDIRDVKNALNSIVEYNGTKYILRGCTIRKDTKTNDIFYQAELADQKARSILVAKLTDISCAK